MHLTLPDNRSLDLARPVVVGVLNVTPDSFSDGGRFASADAAVAHAMQMIDAGADVIDVGGESTRPGSQRVSAGQQIDRVVHVIRALRERTAVPISIDTTRVAVAEAAVDAGAAIINDVSAGRDDDDRLLGLAARRGTPIILMHMLGEPATMQEAPHYDDVVAEVKQFLLDRARAAEAAGVARSQIILDPGIGFGKTIEHNLTLMAHLDTFVATGHAIMLGTSRKRWIGEITGEQHPPDRATGTAATTALGVAAGVHLFRVHDVAPNRQAADVAHAVCTQRDVGGQGGS